MTIQWFPGHMSKALRQAKERLKYVDIVLELRDARIPFSSSNPKIHEVIGGKPRLILLNKAHMADPSKTRAWIEYYEREGIVALPVDCITGYNIKEIVPYAKTILKDLLERDKERGLKERPIKAMIIGIPNVGKSTLINLMAKRKVAQTGDRPGITKALQWINIDNQMMLLDTPGILWPKFENQRVGMHLGLTGAIKDDVMPLDDVAIFGLTFLSEHYPDALKERFKLDELSEDPVQMMDEIGRKRGALLPGNRINYDKVIDIILYEFRNELLGRISLELPRDIEQLSE